MRIFKVPKTAYTYLAKKLTGGAANEKGNKYENFFAVYKIAGLFNLHKKSPQHGSVSGQCNAFIDDFMIDNQGERQYFQLKSSDKATWRNGKNPLYSDFIWQSFIERMGRRRFKLYLVVADQNKKNKLNSEKPWGLKRCAEVLHFPYHDSLYRQIKGDTAFREELRKLSYAGAAEDKLEALGTFILGRWGATDKTNISIKEFYEYISNLNLAFFASNDGNYLSESTVVILNSIEGFTFTINGGYLVWKFGSFDSGIMTYKVGTDKMNAFEREVQELNPTNFNQLEPLLS